MVQPMTMKELEYIVKNCKKNKSPGLDGQETFEIIKEDLLQVFQYQLNEKQLVESNREGVTRLCPKVTGVPTVEELRPITLLNTDYKILSK